MSEERELALKFFSTLSGVKTDKFGTIGQQMKDDHSEGNCEICDGGRIEEALEALARYVSNELDRVFHCFIYFVSVSVQCDEHCFTFG